MQSWAESPRREWFRDGRDGSTVRHTSRRKLSWCSRASRNMPWIASKTYDPFLDRGESYHISELPGGDSIESMWLAAF